MWYVVYSIYLYWYFKCTVYILWLTLCKVCQRCYTGTCCNHPWNININISLKSLLLLLFKLFVKGFVIVSLLRFSKFSVTCESKNPPTSWCPLHMWWRLGRIWKRANKILHWHVHISSKSSLRTFVINHRHHISWCTKNIHWQIVSPPFFTVVKIFTSWCISQQFFRFIKIFTRVHQNSKKFSKSHGLLIYFVPTCI